ncbi:apoptosis-inducing factor 2 [Fusarium longipes]|uniref:Apoptosis-inducing factor 2 n=1 Tax=Fusarium longipes TaxID=694270 RepID=A0A395RVN9_9HYPO|nr:apoptosis-inducing factor 2 [Fusarium longipes]
MGSLPEATNAVRVLILGGCYGGLSAAVNLLDLSQGYSPRMNSEPYTHHPDLPTFNIEITIVDERDGYYHLIGSPMALADSTFSKKNWVKYSDIPGLKDPSINIIQGSVTDVDPAAKQATILAHLTQDKTTLQYDYLVAATGLRRVWPVVPQSLTRKEYLLEAENHINAVQNAKHGVVVVGGGAVGIEMAAELKMVKPHLNVTLVHSRDKLLSSEGLPDETKDVALKLLREAGVEVLMSHRLASKSKVETTDGSEKYDIEFTNGHRMSASVVIMAISRSVPTSTYLPASALDEDGFVKIKPNLQFEQGTPNAGSHYAAGDITKWPGIKRCGGAMHHGHYVALNIHQSILSQRAGHVPSYKEIAVYPPVIGLAVGKKAVASSPDTGTTAGEDVLQSCFRDDLGWTICWNYMQLGGRKTDEAKA